MIILLQHEKNEDFTGNLFNVATNNQAIRTWHQGGMKDIRFKKDYFRSSDYVNSTKDPSWMVIIRWHKAQLPLS